MSLTITHDLPTLIRLACGLMPHWLPESVVVETHLPGGYAHLNYRIRYGDLRFAFRAPAHAPDSTELAFEARWLACLPLDVGARTVAYDTASGALLTAWIEAPLLAHTQCSPDELVSYLVGLHSRLPPVERAYDLSSRVDAWLAGKRLTGAAGRAVQRVRTRQPSTDVTVQTTHNDLNPWNILCAADGWRTVDWEWVGNNDPLFDLVTLALGVQVKDSILADMAADYGDRIRQPISSLADRLNHVISEFWLREYAWAEHELGIGNDRPEVLTQRDHALDMLAQR